MKISRFLLFSRFFSRLLTCDFFIFSLKWRKVYGNIIINYKYSSIVRMIRVRLLCVGDVFASSGTDILLKKLPLFKKERAIDLCIVNGENSADKNGITRESAEVIFAAGADVITGGNHTLRNAEVYDYLDSNPFILRPHNLPSDIGTGYCLYDMGRYLAAVINLSGQVYLEKSEAENPFLAADALAERAKADGARFIIIDFHAEATSEKRALGLYLDGRISAFFGTHTHVQTSDAQVLPGGTGYITDIGMTGVTDSVLGVKKEIIINRLKSKDMSKFYPAEGDSAISGCIFELDDSSGKCISAETVRIK